MEKPRESLGSLNVSGHSAFNLFGDEKDLWTSTTLIHVREAVGCPRLSLLMLIYEARTGPRMHRDTHLLSKVERWM